MKEFFARLNPTERRFVVGVAVVFVIVINIVWVWPRFGDWGETRKRMTTAQNQVFDFNRGIARIPDLDREIAKYMNAGATVPPENQAVDFVRQIQNQAAQSGVGIQSMGGARSTGTNAYFLEQNQTLQLTSGEKQLVDFLYSLGAGPNSLIRVKVMSVQPDSPRQQLSSRVTLVASYQRKSPISTAPGATAPKTPTPATPKATNSGPAKAANTPAKPTNAPVAPKPMSPIPTVRPPTSGPARAASPAPIPGAAKLHGTNSGPNHLPAAPKPLLPNQQ